MEGSNCIATIMNDEEIVSIPVSCVKHVIGCPNDPLLGQKHCTIGGKEPFLHTYLSSTFVICVSWPWIELGTLVVINNDEEDQLQSISVPSTPFDTPFWYR